VGDCEWPGRKWAAGGGKNPDHRDKESVIAARQGPLPGHRPAGAFLAVMKCSIDRRERTGTYVRIQGAPALATSSRTIVRQDRHPRHGPEGANTTRTCPSAGLAPGATITIISVITGIPIRRAVAENGEVTLARIAGLTNRRTEEKLLAAAAGTASTVYPSPSRMKSDLGTLRLHRA